MNSHDTIFHGEDLLMGINSLQLKYTMKTYEGYFVPTQTPIKIIGTEDC